ncbi:transcriptional regulator [Pediococcus parvulus]|nr:transcriptional regulator [Pediococcus parvulus]
MVLATSHILLGSRALKQDELSDTLTFLSSGLPPAMQAELHQQLTIPRGSYVPLSTPKPLLKQLREMTMYIANNQKLVFMYHSSAPGQDYPIKHRAQPVAITFQTHYFYVVMLSEQHGGYWLYRLDRVVKILEAKKGDKLDYAERFSLQDYHHQTYLEDNGTLTRIQFIYRNYKGTALDALPDAHVLKEYADGSLLIEAYVKVGGAMFWLMSQGPGLKVVSPPSLVKRIRDELTAARDQYLE